MNDQSTPHTRLVPPHAWIIAALAALITILVYQPVFSMPFYAEDPLDLGQVRYSDPLHILATNTSSVYYRPLTWLLIKATERTDGTFDPLPLHITRVAAHALNVGLLCLLAWALTGDGWFALLAAGLLAFYPYSYDAIARTTPVQTVIITTLLLTLLCYLKGRLSQQRRWLWISLIPFILGFPVLENALLFGGVVVALEVMLVLRRQVARLSWFPVIHLAATVPFAIVWLLIPKEAGALGKVFDPRVGNLLMQTALWPIPLIAGKIAEIANTIFEPTVLLTVGLGLGFLCVVYWRGRALSWLLVPAAFWIVGSLPIWLVRNYRYVEISPRVFYVAVPGLALLWAGLTTLRFKRSRIDRIWRIGSSAFIGLLILQNLTGLLAIQDLYRHGSQVMNSLIRSAAANTQLVYIDMPDRFELKQRPWPFGWWGMLLAPVSMDLGGYADISRGILPQTISLSAPTVSAAERDTWPYDANLRGVIADSSQLYETALTSTTVYRTHFAPDGSLSLNEAGSISHSPSTTNLLARFDQTAELLSVDQSIKSGTLRVTVWWRSIGAAQPDDTIFVHLDSPAGLIAQNDGDSLDGLIPLPAWQLGDVIRDVRVLNLPPGVDPNSVRLGIGIYNRVSGERLIAHDPAGVSLPDNLLAMPLKNDGVTH